MLHVTYRRLPHYSSVLHPHSLSIYLLKPFYSRGKWRHKTRWDTIAKMSKFITSCDLPLKYNWHFFTNLSWALDSDVAWVTINQIYFVLFFFYEVCNFCLNSTTDEWCRFLERKHILLNRVRTLRWSEDWTLPRTMAPPRHASQQHVKVTQEREELVLAARPQLAHTRVTTIVLILRKM